jgi:regulator of nucleoside diphosphate kinase
MRFRNNAAQHFVQTYIQKDDTMSNQPIIRVTEEDYDHLSELADAFAAAGRRLPHLEAELSRAELVPARPEPLDIVTMNAKVTFEEEGAGTRQEITLVYPHEADIAKGRVSVVTPVGSALLGLGVGQAIDWTLPNGERRRYRVLAVSPPVTA